MADTRQRVEPGPPRPSLWDRLLGTGPGDDWRYIVYLVLIAMAGWALASYDFNLLVAALPTIAASLKLSQTEVGLLAFLVYAAMLILSFVMGYCTDQFGRKVMWQVALAGAAIFTGLTFFVHSFWALVVVRSDERHLVRGRLRLLGGELPYQGAGHCRRLARRDVRGRADPRVRRLDTAHSATGSRHPADRGVRVRRPAARRRPDLAAHQARPGTRGHRDLTWDSAGR